MIHETAIIYDNVELGRNVEIHAYDRDSIFFENISKGVEKKLLSFNADNSRITYNCSREYSTSFKNPEEKAKEFEKSLTAYYNIIQKSEKKLVESHVKIENDL